MAQIAPAQLANTDVPVRDPLFALAEAIKTVPLEMAAVRVRSADIFWKRLQFRNR
jgi:hypothetical protein